MRRETAIDIEFEVAGLLNGWGAAAEHSLVTRLALFAGVPASRVELPAVAQFTATSLYVEARVHEALDVEVAVWPSPPTSEPIAAVATRIRQTPWEDFSTLLGLSILRPPLVRVVECRRRREPEVNRPALVALAALSTAIATAAARELI